MHVVTGFCLQDKQGRRQMLCPKTRCIHAVYASASADTEDDHVM